MSLAEAEKLRQVLLHSLAASRQIFSSTTSLPLTLYISFVLDRSCKRNSALDSRQVIPNIFSPPAHLLLHFTSRSAQVRSTTAPTATEEVRALQETLRLQVFLRICDMGFDLLAFLDLEQMH